MALLKQILNQLNIDLEAIEKDLIKGLPETYAGDRLLPEALYTSEEDAANILASLNLKLGDRVVDLGCGIGSLVLTGAQNYSDITFWGIEVVEERLQVARACAQELKLNNLKLIQGHLTEVNIPRADVYFIYLATGKTYSHLINQLLRESSSRDFKIVAIESHGDLLPDLQSRSWLKVIHSIPLKSERHSPRALIFESINNNYESQLKRSLMLLDRDLRIHGECNWTAEDRHLWEHAFTRNDWKFVSIHRSPKIEQLSCHLCEFSTFSTIKSPETSGDIPLNKIQKIILKD